MDSFKFHDIKAEKANAMKSRRATKITALFRFLELFIFIIILSRFSTYEFNSFSFNLSFEYIRGISVTLVSPRFVFLVGNAIVIVLFLISGYNFSEEKPNVDFYDEYVDKCRSNNSHHQKLISEEKRTSGGVVGYYEVEKEKKKAKKKMMTMSRCKSENQMRVAAAGGGGDLQRSVSEKCRKREDEMSGEEFRRKVEAFIARQQRVLREEEEEGLTAVVSV